MKVSYMLMSDPRNAGGDAVPWRQFLAEAKAWGLEGVDLFPAYLERAGATVDDAARALADLGLEIAVYCVQTDLVSADPAVRQQSLGRVRTFADKAVELGVRHLFSYGGQHQNRGEEALLRYVDGLQQAADLCAERGLLFSIENAGSLCHTHEEMARCLDAVARPNMRLTIDTGNFVLAGSDPHEAIRRLAPRVAHVHVKNFVDAPGRTPWPFRYCPPRAGKVDYAYVVQQLRAVGYGGYVAFEPEGFPDAQAEDGIRYLAALLGEEQGTDRESRESTRMGTGMPKIGIMPRCYLTDIAEGRMDLFAWLDDAACLEPEGHELHAAFFRGRSGSYVEEVRCHAESLGTPVVSLCYAPDFTQPDPAARADEVRRQQDAIRLAADLGAGLCRTLSGQRREGLDVDQAIAWVAECIEAALPVAEECGVKLVIENHYKDAFWTYPEFAQKAEVFLRIVERVRSPHFGVQFDPSNAILAGDDPIALLQQVKGRLVSMHASDRFLEAGASLDDLRQADGTLGYSPKLRHGEIGKGLNDYHVIFTILRDIRYDGWITVEDGDTMESMRNSIRFLRAMRSRYFG